MSLRVLSKKAQLMRSEFGPSKPLDMLCDWTNDPDVCYAFESRAGAAWWQEHGGPPGLCSLLKTRHARPLPPSVPTAKVQSPMCFACDQALCETLQDNIVCTVIKCGCRSRVIHTRCTEMFNGLDCVHCDQRYSMCVRKGPLITVHGRNPDCRGSNGR